MASRAQLGPDFFRFLAELAEHNDRPWFEARKPRYEQSVRDPFLRLIADLAPRLGKLAPHFIADPSLVGGSMLRIYRDVRFSRDKRPYKTAVAAHFWLAPGRSEEAPALYLHLEPGKSSFGGGLWRPAPPLAKKVRDAIARDAVRWRRIVNAPGFTSTFHLTGESLKRVPPRYDRDSSLAADLRRKDFIISSGLADRQVSSKDLPDDIVGRCKAAMPFMRFLVDAIGSSGRGRS